MEAEKTDGAPGERTMPWVGRVGGLLTAVAVWMATTPLTQDQRIVATSAVLMGVWWATEALPMWATALVVLIGFPALGVVDPIDVVAIGGNSLILLFVGGMLLAKGIESCGLHRRIAIRLLAVVGTSPRRLVLGLMLAGAGLSMFVSNSATALMLFPVAHALVVRSTPEGPRRRALGAAAMLGLAYGCNAGGAASLIGTPPNLIFAQAYASQYPDMPPVGFGRWLLVGLPFLVCFLPLAWLYLTRVAFRLPATTETPSEPEQLAPRSSAQTFVLAVFLAAVAAWMTREAWDGLLPCPASYGDAVVGLLAAAVLFIAPVRRAAGGERRPVLVPRDLARLPFGLLVLIAGGLVLSDGFQRSGLTEVAGQWLEQWDGTDAAWIVGGTALVAVALSALTSNTGSAGVLAPLLMASAPVLGVDPRFLLFAGALGVSCDFALPVGTPPNAVVFGSGWLRLGQMARIGAVVDIAAVLLIALVVRGTVGWLLGASVL